MSEAERLAYIDAQLAFPGSTVSRDDALWMRAEIARLSHPVPEGQGQATEARLRSYWHEDFGPVLWWVFPVMEPPYVGSPLHDDWPGYHTHWTPIPVPSPPPSPGEAPCWRCGGTGLVTPAISGETQGPERDAQRLARARLHQRPCPECSNRAPPSPGEGER